MDNNLEFLMEQGKLQETLNILDKEILNYITKRKYITEYILDARKKYVEEYKDDEDKIIDYFDHETYVKEEAYKTIDKKLKEYSILKESPYFGKITFSEEEEGVEDIYIGRFGVTLEETYEPIVIDWRAPIAGLFYKGVLGKSEYISPEGPIEANILGRRQIIVKKGDLKGIFDSAIDVKDEILQMVLTANSSSTLKDIVMTIQSEQDEIIRAPRNKVVVVNGVAGSGKTTIALHRVSYLLYNYRKEFGDKVLILGPNNIFMDYISEVLPTLGESGVSESTFENFAYREINLNEEFITFSEYMEKAMQGDEDFIEDYRYKSSDKYLSDLNDIVKELNNSYFKIRNVEFFGEEIVSLEEIKELFTKYYGYMPLFRRSEKIRRILTSKIKDKRDECVRNINNEFREQVKSLSEEQLEIDRVNLEFRRRLKIREVVREVMNAREVLDSWLKHEDIVELYKRLFKVNMLNYMDLSGILYLMIMLDGKKVKNKIKHVVIDEAQDYSKLQFLVLRELTGCTSFTIVGDSNQRLITTDEKPAILTLEEVFGDKVMNYKLNKSYRSTQQIMEYASKFLKEETIVPLVRNGEKVLVEDVNNDEDMIETIISLIEDYEEDGLESIAVIIDNKDNMQSISTLLKERVKIVSFDNDDMIYKGGNVLIPAYYAKGLEFDGVIILDDNEKTSDLVKYIMCTRALHRLSVVKRRN
ncbi:AAA family ATPase [Clostridium sp. MSJ-8]|uniref:HelD family protein n=1 Tax=Clostridium sp. MSJ-8 TaxID=2841510 RepID=UPI001C0F22F8|nr:UvrD-helicase domain-containing protein [Clostridium sp. MSJ-8]MBU5488251.1 AAA family ATPase [Clostridium sp. MSJ-8]